MSVVAAEVRAEGRKAVNFALGVLVDCLLIALVGRPLKDSTTVCWNVTDVWALPLGWGCKRVEEGDPAASSRGHKGPAFLSSGKSAITPQSHSAVTPQVLCTTTNYCRQPPQGTAENYAYDVLQRVDADKSGNQLPAFSKALNSGPTEGLSKNTKAS
ncbi:MAG: hypothetical protein FRX49_09483 [Trebouxia sp. A1-2]|nr:MAG: hypothetical protein FRX49_09483 [Trebouxia sp. A1-2]